MTKPLRRRIAATNPHQAIAEQSSIPLTPAANVKSIAIRQHLRSLVLHEGIVCLMAQWNSLIQLVVSQRRDLAPLVIAIKPVLINLGMRPLEEYGASEFDPSRVP
jgi:hypothetical protein